MFEKIISKSPGTPPAPRPAAAPQSTHPLPGAPQAAPSTTPTQSVANPSTPPQQSSPTPTGGQRNILSNDVHINGSVRFTNDLLVDGRIEGKISSDGALTVAENAVIKAEVSTKSIVIYGKVHGNVTCSDRVDIKGSAEMVGDVKAGTLSIEPGAIFVGKSEVGTPTAALKNEQPTPPAGNSKKNSAPTEAKAPTQAPKAEENLTLTSESKPPQDKGGSQTPKKG